MFKHKNPLKSKTLTIVIAVVILAAAGISLYFSMWRNTGNNSGKPAPTNTVDYSPPTDIEQKAGDAQKDANSQKEDTIAKQPTGQRSASVTVVDASQYNDTVEVRAYVSNVYEDGGTCTVNLTKSGQSVIKTRAGFKDATTTQCGTFKIARSEFPSAGDWNLKVTYSSPAATGEAAPRTVAIQ